MQKNNCSNTKIVVKDFSSVEKLTLPFSASKIKEILDFSAQLFITSNKIIKTMAGYNLIIKGFSLIKIRYLSNDCRGKVILKKLICPFFKTIPISPCFNKINFKANLSYYDIDNCNDTILFYNIISVCLSMSFTPTQSIIKCLNSCSNCCDDWQFKNDCYPSKVDSCCNKVNTNIDYCTCFTEENCSKHNNCSHKEDYFPTNDCC